MHELIKDIINRGIADGTFRSGLDVDATAALIMQSALGAMRLQVLGAELNGAPVDADHIYDFCVAGLLDHPARPTASDLRVAGVKSPSRIGGVLAGPDVVMSLPPERNQTSRRRK